MVSVYHNQAFDTPCHPQEIDMKKLRCSPGYETCPSFTRRLSRRTEQLFTKAGVNKREQRNNDADDNKQYNSEPGIHGGHVDDEYMDDRGKYGQNRHPSIFDILQQNAHAKIKQRGHDPGKADKLFGHGMKEAVQDNNEGAGEVSVADQIGFQFKAFFFPVQYSRARQGGNGITQVDQVVGWEKSQVGDQRSEKNKDIGKNDNTRAKPQRRHNDD